MNRKRQLLLSIIFTHFPPSREAGLRLLIPTVPPASLHGDHGCWVAVGAPTAPGEDSSWGSTQLVVAFTLYSTI